MFALVSKEKITLPPGALLRLPATWEDYQALSAQRDERSLPRLKYLNGELLIMSPLPKHGRDVHLVASIITTLLQYFNQDYEAFTPITLTVAN